MGLKSLRIESLRSMPTADESNRDDLMIYAFSTSSIFIPIGIQRGGLDAMYSIDSLRENPVHVLLREKL
jgi:hypothetical protein